MCAIKIFMILRNVHRVYSSDCFNLECGGKTMLTNICIRPAKVNSHKNN